MQSGPRHWLRGNTGWQALSSPRRASAIRGAAAPVTPGSPCRLTETAPHNTRIENRNPAVGFLFGYPAPRLVRNSFAALRARGLFEVNIASAKERMDFLLEAFSK